MFKLVNVKLPRNSLRFYRRRRQCHEQLYCRRLLSCRLFSSSRITSRFDFVLSRRLIFEKSFDFFLCGGGSVENSMVLRVFPRRPVATLNPRKPTVNSLGNIFS